MRKSKEKDMSRVSADISNELNARLKAFVIKKSGMLRGGQSDIIAEAISQYLDREEKKR